MKVYKDLLQESSIPILVQVFITPFAAENIREAFKWYQLENPIYAAKWKTGLEDAIQALGTFPHAHALASVKMVLLYGWLNFGESFFRFDV